MRHGFAHRIVGCLGARFVGQYLAVLGPSLALDGGVLLCNPKHHAATKKQADQISVPGGPQKRPPGSGCGELTACRETLLCPNIPADMGGSTLPTFPPQHSPLSYVLATDCCTSLALSK